MKSFMVTLSIQHIYSIEIRTLDSELQTLVYENYNKFISATDIIKNVNFPYLPSDQKQHG